MSKATFTFVRVNPPTEEGHGKVVKAIQAHAEKTGGRHYIFPSHSQDAKKNPLAHGEKVGFMRRLFPTANIVSSGKVRTAIDAMKHLEKQGHTEVTMVVGSDRVDNFHSLLNKYRTKEYPGIKKVNVVSAGNRDPDAEGAEGMSASKLRGLVAAGKEKEFISHYSDPKLGKLIHDKVKAGMQMESVSPIGIFLLGGPGSGKDYVLKNIFSRFDLTEVQADQILNGAAAELLEQNANIVINGVSDSNKIVEIQTFLERYSFDFVHVSVTNKVSRLRNEQREQPLIESKRIDKFLKAEKLAEETGAFVFNNSINLNESSEMEKLFFGSQIEKLLERVVDLGLEMKSTPEPKTFTVIKEKYFPLVAKHKSGLPKKYVGKLSDTTASARKAHWKKMSKYSDKDPRAYEPAPGDATAKTKPSKHTLAVRKMMSEGVAEKIRKHPAVQEYTNEKRWDGNINHVITLKPGYWHKDSKLTVLNPSSYSSAEEMLQKVELTPRQVNANKVTAAIDLNIAHKQSGHRMLGVRKHIQNEENLPKKLRKVARSGNVTAVMDKRKETGRVDEAAADKSLSAKASKSGVSLSTLKKVYRRGVAAWNSGHRPGTTPQQWGHARVNSYINKGKTYHTSDKDLREEEQIDEMDKSQPATGRDSNTPFPKPKPIKLTDKQSASAKLMTRELLNQAKKQLKKEEIDINELFEMQLVGTDEYRKHAIAMTPGQGEPVDAFPVKSPNKKPVAVVAKPGKSIVFQYTEEHTNCGTPDCCGKCTDAENTQRNIGNFRKLSEIRSKFSQTKKILERPEEVDFTPIINTKNKKKSKLTPMTPYNANLDGLPVATRLGITAMENLSISEAVEYHLDNKISFTENVFRPGSDMFFQMIGEAKRLYSEGKYTPADEWEKDMLNSNIGEIDEFEGQTVVLDYPIEEGLEEACWSGYTQKGLKKKGNRMVPNCVPVNEEDKTDGKGIGKPWREGGGGAVYVRTGDGGIKKVRFSQSGMKKKFMDPAATRSFVARHHCLTNKDKTSASYWACRYPRFFSNSGKTWW